MASARAHHAHVDGEIMDIYDVHFPSMKDMPLPEYLQAITKAMLEAPNRIPPEANEEILGRHCSTDFKVTAGRPETNLIASNLEQHTRNLKAFIAANPDYHIEVQNTTIQLDDRTGRAVIFCTTRVSGLFGAHGVRQSVNQVRARRRQDEHWVAYELASLRGPGHLTF
ncbi:uncharacterized protein CLAFUR5_09920 [Fulvia fulva]|uniref:Uncharacterized protein n=1 Tax=Passalora fulva TaxID=5499 RepID=A0A9Q8PDJ6_PASFU|nr:uncharacterized protein CLAFUR5_09920 [Fulvia fulva]UJO20465.1 hypothetical protein CLAFUR5_09920 [Fulvia fulva]